MSDPSAPRGPLAVLSRPPFRGLWSASLISNMGALIQLVAAAWLMTSLSESGMMVSLVQASVAGPVMAGSLVAGVLADLGDIAAGDDGGIDFAMGGALGGGVLADRLAKRDRRWYGWLSAIVSLAAFPFAVLFVLAPDRNMALLAFAPFYLLNNTYLGSLWTLVQGLVAPSLRATASATQLAVTNLIGYGVGPAVVGVANDALAPRFGDESIRYSLLGAAVVGAATLG